MDLLFDTQVLSHRGSDELPEPVLASISGYYRRATTTSRPMSYLIALVMVILLGALGFAWFSDDPLWLLAVTSVLAAAPILLAMLRTFPNAVRLGNRADGVVQQSRLARAICRDHLLCLVLMSAFLALWIAV
jgi:hypothetical protein